MSEAFGALAPPATEPVASNGTFTFDTDWDGRFFNPIRKLVYAGALAVAGAAMLVEGYEDAQFGSVAPGFDGPALIAGGLMFLILARGVAKAFWAVRRPFPWRHIVWTMDDDGLTFAFDDDSETWQPWSSLQLITRVDRFIIIGVTGRSELPFAFLRPPTDPAAVIEAFERYSHRSFDDWVSLVGVKTAREALHRDLVNGAINRQTFDDRTAAIDTMKLD